MNAIFIITIILIVAIVYIVILINKNNKNNKMSGGDEKSFPNELIAELYSTRLAYLPNGDRIKMNANIGNAESRLLYNLVKDNNLQKCVEVGMAMGLSALSICQGLKDNNNKSKNKALISIDPFQTKKWKSIGLNHVKKAGLSEFHKFMEGPSYEMLPKLLKFKNNMDLVFIDGWHTFDYTLVDMFYANLLVKSGGYILIDDVLHEGPKDAIKYVDKNYNHWRRIYKNVPKTQALYVKKKIDSRPWNYHVQI
jgi:predicted O-methyltransferase YrrM